LLAAPEATPVLDRETTQTRPLRASDIAILVATNTHAEKLAEHLKTRGVHSVLARTGLMTTPEGTLLVAALRFLADRHDSLAAAEIEALLGFSNGDHEAWLSQRITHHDAAMAERKRRTAARESDDTATPNDTATPDANDTATPDANDTATLTDTATRETNETLQALNELRPSLSHLSPMEVVDQVLATLNFPKLARRWPDPEQRLANLDALRALVAAYENRATYLREAASLQGLLRYFEETQEKVKQQDEERASDEQHVLGSTDAVILSTYHKSKGLEWPVVVLADLDREGRRDVFDVLPESDEDVFDATDPLGKRWIRYWPWPLGLSRKAALRDRAESSEVGKRLAQREARERVRLLYVGFTRARDHLVLAVPASKKGELKCAWLDELRDEVGPLLQLPRENDEEHTLGLRGEGETFGVAARVWSLNTSDEAPKNTTGGVGVFNEVPRSHDLSTNGRDDHARTSNDAGANSGAGASYPSRLWYAARATPRAMQRYIITPSEAADAEIELPTPRILSSERLTHRLPFTSPKGKTWDEVGNALHAFLAADEHHLSANERLALAQRILNATWVGNVATLGDSFRPEDLLSASDALRGFVSARWPAATWHREVPIAALLDTRDGTRAVNGTIDLWLETEAGGIVIDHKSFPGAASSWNEQALKHAPQLFTYGLALRAAGKRVLGYFVHFVVGGGMVEVGE
jgi:ATP-dependent exoDNAse (exonuclease V) beta subunit